jgi:citrate/tricarballylate utilization protein
LPDLTLVEEVERQLTVCNACRYCEGYCAVFPAMELRRTFDQQDVIHLSNLCFDCRACYNACPYTPPHDYQINLPAVFAEVREQTYAEFSGPRLLSKLFHGNQFMVGLVVFATIALVFGSVLLVQGADVLFGVDAEEGSFYRIVPYWAMVIPAMVLSGWWLAVLAVGAVRFWRSTGANAGQMIDAAALAKATKDAFGLEYLKGGGEGCDYPTEKKSMSRRFYQPSHAAAGLQLPVAADRGEHHGAGADAAARNRGAGHAADRTPGNDRGVVFSTALREVRPRRVPLRRTRPLPRRDGAGADGRPDALAVLM